MRTDHPTDSRLLPLVLCGAISSALASLCAWLWAVGHGSGAHPLIALSVVLGCCAVIASQAANRAAAWRGLWLLIGVLCLVTAWQTFAAMFGSPSQLIPQTRSENAAGIAFFVLIAELLIGLLGPVFFGFLSIVAFFLAWLLGRQAPKRIVA